jgi:hypothetical protein
MSWVTDIILLTGLEEQFLESGELTKVPPAVKAINTWLKSRESAPLVRFDEYIGMRSECGFQACAYGAAMNHFEIPPFLEVVGKQAWQAPQALLVLLKDEEDRNFTVYRMRRRKLEKC